MSENNFETKKSSKEIWLVLIFVDLIALCVFSYLIYSSFINSDKKEIKINRDQKTEQVVLEEIDLSETIKQEPKKEPKEVKTQTETKTNIKKESVKISGSGKWRQVTFKYFDAAKSVAIVSGFTSTKPRDLKKVNGVWEITLTISPGTYRYMFVVDGKEVKDPYNKQESNGRSVVVIK